MTAKTILLTIGGVVLLALLASLLQISGFFSASDLGTRTLQTDGSPACQDICSQSCAELPQNEQGQCMTECVTFCGEGL